MNRELRMLTFESFNNFMVIVSLTDLGHMNVTNLHISKRERVLHVRFSFLCILLFVLVQWTTLNELFELNGNSKKHQ